MFAIKELEEMVKDPSFPKDKVTETEEAIDSFRKFNKFLYNNFGLNESEAEEEFNDFLDSKEEEVEKNMAPVLEKVETFENEEEGNKFLIKEISKEIGKSVREFAEDKGYDRLESRNLEVSTRKVTGLLGDVIEAFV